MASSNRSLALLSSILHTPTPLPSIRSLHLTWSKVGASQSSMRHFLRLKLPIVRFHNPDLPIVFDQRKDEDVRAAIHCDTGQTLSAHPGHCYPWATAPTVLVRGLISPLSLCTLSVYGPVTLYPADIGVDSAIFERLSQVGRAQSEVDVQAAAATAANTAALQSPPPVGPSPTALG